GIRDKLVTGVQTCALPISHPLGTDELGRDILSRLLYASRITLSVSLAATVLVNLIGVPLGAMAAYRRGWLETIVMRFTDVMLSRSEERRVGKECRLRWCAE